MKKDIRKRFYQNAAVILFPLITVLILSPLEIYQGNQGELNFSAWDFVGIFTGISILLLVLAAGILTILPDRLSTVCRAVIFVCSALAYLQNLLLNKQLMRTDGSRMDWSELKSEMVQNAVLWCVLAAALVTGLVLLKDKKNKIMAAASAFFSVVELVAVASILLTLPAGSQQELCLLDGEGQLSVAGSQNVIIFILDRYGNVTFENGYENSADFTKPFQDFTYYQNANSTYNYTFPSIPYMLTQKTPVETQTAEAYKKDAWENGRAEEFYRILKKKGYSYRLYTGSGRSIYADAGDLEGRVDNLKKLPQNARTVHHGRLTFLLFKASLYKHAPYFLKPRLEVMNYFYDGVVSYDGKQPVEDNAAYYAMLQEEGLSIDSTMEKQVIITHLSGIHTPYTIGENGEKVPENDTALWECQKGLNVLLEEYMKQLKQLGLYESATIIITADHGLYVDALDPQPILLIKQPGEMHEQMEFCNAPVSSEDFLPSVLECIGEDPGRFGTPYSSWSDESIRERQCCYPDHGFDVYTYTGDREVLKDKIRSGDYSRMEMPGDWD